MPSRRVPPERRKRTEISCDKCKGRKQKCNRPADAVDGQAPCRYCQTHGFECVTTQQRKRRIYASVEGLGTRIELLESLVKGLAPEVDTSSVDGMRELGKSLGIPLPPPPSSPEDEREDSVETKHDPDEEVPVLRDQQGQTQYIGPSSSYLFQIRIRSLFAGQPQNQGQFFLFGSNPTEREWTREVSGLEFEISSGKRGALADMSAGGSEGSRKSSDASSVYYEEEQRAAGLVPDTLIATFFDSIHPDFPVLHEASFREEYERYCLSPSLLTAEADPAWVCSLLCVLLLARRKIHVDPRYVKQGQEAENRWYRKVQAMLSSVIFTSSVSSVQALILAGLHLHNTNHRDLCWTLTGSAVRIAIAVGLHQDSKATVHTPLTRELRKRLWWTLYSFELMQAAALDRPSAIDDAACLVGNPRQSILGGNSDSMAYSNRLTVLLSRTCRVVRAITSHPESADEATGPLSPAAGLVRDLASWRDSLPRHLGLAAVGGLPPPMQRTAILLHVQYHHVLCVLSRNAMLALAARIFSTKPETPKARRMSSAQRDSPNLADVCAESAQETVRLLLRLESIGGFDSNVWMDMYFIYAAALVLVLDILCEFKQYGANPQSQSSRLPESRNLLGACSELSNRLLHDPLLPGTNHRYCVVMMELNNMTRELIEGRQGQARVDEKIPQQAPEMPQERPQMEMPMFNPVVDGSMLMGHNEADYAANFHAMQGGMMGGAMFDLPDAGWTWRDGQWNDFAAVLLGNDYHPTQAPPPPVPAPPQDYPLR